MSVSVSALNVNECTNAKLNWQINDFFENNFVAYCKVEKGFLSKVIGIVEFVFKVLNDIS